MNSPLKNKKGFIGTTLLFIGAAALIVLGLILGKNYTPQNQQLLGAQFNPVQAQKTYLYGSGIIVTDTSIKLTSLKLPNGTPLVMSNFGDIGFATIDAATTREENIKFTGITQSGDGTATLNGVSRGLSFVAPYAASTSLAYAHSGGSPIILSNSSAFYNQFAIANNTTTVNANWTFNSSTLPSASSDTTAGQFSGNAGMNFINYNTLASSSFAGTINGSVSAKGIYQEATKAQSLAGTAAGSTGADLILPNSSVNGSSTGAFLVPISGSTGQIDSSFLPTSSALSWTGTSTFTGTIKIQNSSTSIGTVTIGTTTLNGLIDFTNASTTGLSLNKMFGLATTTLDCSQSTNGVATTTIASTTLPAGFLSATKTTGIRGTINLTGVSTGNSGFLSVTARYGGATFANFNSATNSDLSQGAAGLPVGLQNIILQFELYSQGANKAWGFMRAFSSSSTSPFYNGNIISTSTIGTAVFDISTKWSATGSGACTLNSYSLESINF